MNSTQRLVSKIVFSLLIANSSSVSLAYSLNAEAAVGRRWFDFDAARSMGLRAAEVSAAGFVQPADEYPVSVGLRYSHFFFNDADLPGSDNASASLNQLSLVAKTWLPDSVIPGLPVTPYLKVSYSLLSQLEISDSYDDSSAKLKGELHGFHIDLGVERSITENISVFGELSLGQDEVKWKSASQTVNGRSRDVNTKNYDVHSQAILVGATMKI